MNNTEKQLLIAAQYLSAAGKNYVERKDDDSHTNLGWITERRVFQSREFTNGNILELNACKMELVWHGVELRKFQLVETSHKDVLTWLGNCATDNRMAPFEFDLHYEIECGEIEQTFVFSEIDRNYCMKLAEFRSLAYASCKQVLKKLKLEGEVRTWPHHFDTGTYVQMSDFGIGFGMAVPDSISKDYYLYSTGYKGHDHISSKKMPPLSKGEWGDKNWKGALLSVENLESTEWLRFFEESIHSIIQYASHH